MKTANEFLRENDIDMNSFILSADYSFVINAMKEYARQACEAQRDLCMGGMGWKPEKVLQIPLIELK